MHSSPRQAAGDSAKDLANVRFGNKSEIDCVTIDDLANQLELTRLDMIKMDIEGAELEALEGCSDVIEQFSPSLAIASYHYRKKEQTYYKVERYLRRKGYCVKTFFPPHLTTCGTRFDEA